MIKKVTGMYFSATGTTKRVVCAIVEELAELLQCEHCYIDFTLPRERTEVRHFTSEELVVFGTPVYAGRVPNVLLDYIRTVRGNGALGIPIVLFGNRNYDEALAELNGLLTDDGFLTIAGGAFVGEHSFSKILGAGRPDERDMALIGQFAHDLAERLNNKTPEKVSIPGVYPIRTGYYQPRDRHQNPVDIRKVKPKTSSLCNDCKLCAKVCPMGSIDFEEPSEVPGICIKCGSCIKKCPVGAKYYDAESYLYHQHELEAMYTRRAEPSIFL